MKRYEQLNAEDIKELRELIRTGKDVKEVRRAQAILLLNDGANYGAIETLTHYKERAVLVFRQRYIKKGLEGIEHKRKGKPKSLLSSEQRKELLKILTEQTPKNHGLEEEYWTTSLLAYLIEKKYGVVYKTKKPFYLLFSEARYTFHKPGKVYEKRDEEKVKLWKEEMKKKLSSGKKK